MDNNYEWNRRWLYYNDGNYFDASKVIPIEDVTFDGYTRIWVIPNDVIPHFEGVLVVGADEFTSLAMSPQTFAKLRAFYDVDGFTPS